MDLLYIYSKICLIRAFENKLDELFKKGLIFGTAHLCIGQEFIPVIISQYLEKNDFVTSTHRGHGHAIAKGLNIEKFLLELMGKEGGYNKGRAGSQHVISKENNFYANGITGGMVPVANGIAFANKYNNSQSIVLAYMGDGGFNEGYVLESLNLAMTLKLPILFVCENNFYAMSTPTSYSHSSQISEKIKSFGIKVETVTNNDFKKLDEVAKRFIDEVRLFGEPRFIEVRTYRHKGHSKNDMNLYRSKDEEQFWFKLDVLNLIESELIGQDPLNEKKLDEIKNYCQETIENILNKILKSELN